MIEEINLKIKNDKELLKKLKLDFFDKIESIGIPKSAITLKISDGIKNPDYLGYYKTHSNLSSNPIIYLNIDLHKEEMNKKYGKLDFLNQENIDLLSTELMRTLMHEYGHVIEEWVNKFYEQNSNLKRGLAVLKRNFNDNEDFAESFSKHINSDTYLEDNKVEAIEEIVKIFTEDVFTEEDLIEVKKPIWEKELNLIMTKNKDLFEELKTMNGSFDKCKRMSSFLVNKFSSKVDATVIKLDEAKFNLLNAHKEWKQMGPFFAVHYAVLVNNDTIIDLTFKQFDSTSDFPYVANATEYLKKWENSKIINNIESNSSFKLKTGV